jgi:hypothetical protein
VPPFICRPGKYLRLRDHLDPLLEAHREETHIKQAGLVCSICEETVPFDDLRAHLAAHNPGAWAFDIDEVWACFLVRR